MKLKGQNSYLDHSFSVDGNEVAQSLVEDETSQEGLGVVLSLARRQGVSVTLEKTGQRGLEGRTSRSDFG